MENKKATDEVAYNGKRKPARAGQGMLVDYTDYLMAKLIFLVVAAFVYHFWKTLNIRGGRTQLEPREPAAAERPEAAKGAPVQLDR